MADPSPISRRSLPSADSLGGGPPSSPGQASGLRLPPSPESSRSWLGGARVADLHVDKPGTWQLVVVVVLGLVLVAVPLYLWRRPRVEAIVTAAPTGPQSAALGAQESTTGASRTLAEERASVGPVKTRACQDPGAKKTAAAQCDHLEPLEKAFVLAVEQSTSCVPKEAGGGTIVFGLDVSFKRKSLTVTTPREGRSLKAAKVVAACQAAVKAKLAGTSLEGVAHAHARYKLLVTATFPGPTKL